MAAVDPRRLITYNAFKHAEEKKKNLSQGLRGCLPTKALKLVLVGYGSSGNR